MLLLLLLPLLLQMAQFNSPLRCLANVVETEGLRGLTRGFLPTLCREIPGNALFFTVYEGLRRTWPGRPAAAHGSSSSSGASNSLNSSGLGSSSSSSSSSGSGGSLAAAWQVVVDAGGAIVCGGMAGVVVSFIMQKGYWCRTCFAFSAVAQLHSGAVYRKHSFMCVVRADVDDVTATR
jgi:hypothetical protein